MLLVLLVLLGQQGLKARQALVAVMELLVLPGRLALRGRPDQMGRQAQRDQPEPLARHQRSQVQLELLAAWALLARLAAAAAARPT